MRQRHNGGTSDPRVAERFSRLHVIGVVWWNREPIVFEKCIGYGCFVPECQQLIELHFRKRLVVYFAQALEHFRVSILSYPATQPAGSQFKNGKLAENFRF